MGLLYALESIRTPVLDKIMSVITLLGGELFFMVIAVAVFWCVSKREGYYLMIVHGHQPVSENTVLRAPAVGKGSGLHHRGERTGGGHRLFLPQRAYAERRGHLRRYGAVYE